jgi:hypothetical protein
MFRRLLYWRRGHGISILIPFQCSDNSNQRAKNWDWLEKYWKAHLPGAEIIMGSDSDAARLTIPFSKAAAVNDAASKAKGDVFVIVDADGYVSTEMVLKCVEEIRTARKRKNRLWFIPYRSFYRLNQNATSNLLDSAPEKPLKFSAPPDKYHTLDTGSTHGHLFGALIQIVPREAFELVGGWDKRFCGWGGEDVAAMHAFDTLYWPHKTTPDQVLHMWHPMFSLQGTSEWVHWKERVWEGQTSSNSNGHLSMMYHAAINKPQEMRKLVGDGLKSTVGIKPSNRANMPKQNSV